MHEMGIAQSVIDMAISEAQARCATKVRRVSVTVGELSGVDTESLRFCFECLRAETILEAAALDIVYMRRTQRCRGCGHRFEVKDEDVRCPECRCDDTEFAGGDELELSHLELEVA